MSHSEQIAIMKRLRKKLGPNLKWKKKATKEIQIIPTPKNQKRTVLDLQIEDYVKKEIEQNRLTQDTWEIKKIGKPFLDKDGLWKYPVIWVRTFEPPMALTECAETMKKTVPCYQGKSIEAIKADLIEKHKHNIQIMKQKLQEKH